MSYLTKLSSRYFLSISLGTRQWGVELSNEKFVPFIFFCLEAKYSEEWKKGNMINLSLGFALDRNMHEAKSQKVQIPCEAWFEWYTVIFFHQFN